MSISYNFGEKVDGSEVTYAAIISGFPVSINTDSNVQMYSLVLPTGGDKTVTVVRMSFFCAANKPQTRELR